MEAKRKKHGEIKIENARLSQIIKFERLLDRDEESDREKDG